MATGRIKGTGLRGTKGVVEISVTLGDSEEKSRPETAAFAFDAEGTFVARADLADGKATLKADREIAQVLIGALPPKFDGVPSVDLLLRRGAVNVDKESLRLGKIHLDLDPDIWHHWLFASCRVQGRVLKVNTTGAVTQELPICHAIVHICEVDTLFWLIDRLPDFEIARLGQELVGIVEQPIPAPDPDPGPLTPVIRAKRVFGSIDTVALNPQPLPPRERFDFRLPAEIRSGLLAPSSLAIRQSLRNNLKLLIPNLCWFEWLRPWFHRVNELTTAETDDDGGFAATVWYPRFGDHPDLYFWVEAPVSGTLVTVFRPPIPCNTWWDYACGTDVTLRVTDPRVSGCGNHPTVLGKVVILRSVGGSISAGEIERASAGTRQGLSPGAEIAGLDSPFGGLLDLRADFGTGLVAAGVTHYAWSARQLGSTSDADWLRLSQPVLRYYETTASPPEFKTVQIGPDPGVAGSFTILSPPTPGDFAEWHPIEDHIDQATAYFNTTTLPGGALSEGTYELKLELFRPVGGNLVRVNLSAEGIGAFEVEQTAPFGGATITPAALPPGTPGSNDRLLYDAGNVVGLRLVLHVDNRPCSADILDVTLDGQPAGRCGFLEYASSVSSARLSFEASQPGNFAQFAFATTRVATVLGSAGATGNVADLSVGGFNRVGSTFAKDIAVAALLSEGVPTGVVPCTRSAFAEVLEVKASATNGDSRLSYLDAPRTGQVGTRAFAIEEAAPVTP